VPQEVEPPPPPPPEVELLLLLQAPTPISKKDKMAEERSSFMFIQSCMNDF